MIIQRSMRASALLFAGALVAGAAAGCAARQNLALERARAAYETAQTNPQVATHARAELAKAGSTLREAEEAFAEDEGSAEVNHLALLSEKEVEIARSKATERSAEAQAQVLDEQRATLAAAAQAQRTELEIRLAELQARETERGLVVTLGDVLFETDKAELRPGAADKLRQLVTVLQESPDRAVLVEGHADSRGSSSYNRDLSQRRADSVRAFMVRHGVASDRIVAAGYGEEYPVATNATVEGQTMNRRVEVVLLKAGATPQVGRVTVR